MHYTEINKVSVKEFAEVLLRTGTTWFGLSCRTNLVSDVILNGININKYLPQERKCSDGTSYVDETLAGDIFELLKESDGKEVTIYTHNGEAHYFAIEGDNVVFKGYDNNCY